MIKTIESICCMSKRVTQIRFYNEEKGEVTQSHTLSYLEARKYYQEQLGEQMGLDKQGYNHGEHIKIFPKKEIERLK